MVWIIKQGLLNPLLLTVMFRLITVPGGNDEAAEYVDERDEGGSSGKPPHRIGGMVATTHQLCSY